MESANNASNAIMLAMAITAIAGYLNYQFDQRQRQTFAEFEVIKFSKLAQFIAYLSTFIATILAYMFIVEPPSQPGSFVFAAVFALAYFAFIIRTFRYRSYFNEHEFITTQFYSNKIYKHRWQDIEKITEKNVGHQANNLQYTVFFKNGKKFKLISQMHTNCVGFILLANTALASSSKLSP